MARRQNWISYVYAVWDGPIVAYIGKGTGNRHKVQQRRFGLPVTQLAWFKTEVDAYKFERKLIAQLKPEFNKMPGGSGSYSKPPSSIYHRTADDVELDKIGTRAYAAKILLWWHAKWQLHMSPADELMWMKVYNGRA